VNRRDQKTPRTTSASWIAVVALLAAGVSWSDARGGAQSPTTVTFPNGVVYAVEVPQTPEAQRRGLMFRAHLAPRSGMLFVFPETALHAFWMKNCLIALDLVWLDETRRVVAIQAEAPPCPDDPCQIYRPSIPSRYVLEIAGGAAAREKLTVGSAVRF
jgi:uncharacterized membrane protein (UPF0127 family)